MGGLYPAVAKQHKAERPESCANTERAQCCGGALLATSTRHGMHACNPRHNSLALHTHHPGSVCVHTCVSCPPAAPGGLEFDGVTEISPVCDGDPTQAAELITQLGADAVVVSGVHAPLNPAQEVAFAERLRQELQSRAPGGWV